MKTLARRWAAKIGWRLPLSRLLSERRPVVLTYHGIPAQGLPDEVDARAFERQMLFLKTHFDLVSMDSLAMCGRSLRSRVQVLLTFDDGFRNNAEVVAPILRRNGIPAVFFVCSRHAMPGRYLWFSYLRTLERWFKGKSFRFRGQVFDMSASKRKSSVAVLKSLLLDLRPHPAAMYQAIDEECPRLEDFAPAADLADRFAGMSAEQVEELSADPLFTIGIHTVDHPYLTKCDTDEVGRQIEDNKSWIERFTHKKCDLIAYPVGDYGADVLRHCERLNLRWGFSVENRIAGDARLQLFRVGIYRPSLDELGFKVRWGRMLMHAHSRGYIVNH
jgi:peptidoglycan/xylan/chitin deacetylase (PgdA/CDA1 family)